MAERIRRRSTSLAARLSIPDWRELNEDQPFHDPTTDEYCIVVSTDATYVDADVIQTMRPVARTQGVANLFKFYNKALPTSGQDQDPQDPRADLEMFMAQPRRYGMIHASKYHLDSRPCSTLRFLVCINGEFWDSIPNNPPRFLLPVPRPPITTVVNYELSSLPSLLNSIADSLDEYSGEISSHQNGNVSPDVNLAREAKRLRAVYPSIQRMLMFNGIQIVPATTNRVIQLNFTADYTLDSVGIKNTGTNDISRKLDIGFASFKRANPMKFVRTRRYVATLNQIKEALDCPTPPPWYEFITEFSHDTAFVIDRFANSRRGRQMIGDVKKIFKDANTVLTKEEVQIQKESLNTDKKLEQAKKRAEETNFVGNLLLSAGATKEVMDSINTSKEAYDKIINKVDLKYLGGVAMRMLTSETAQEDFNRKLFETSLKVLDFVELNKMATECVNPDVLAASGAFDDIDESCPEDVEKAAAKIAELVSQGHADNECMANAIEKICPTPARLFGWRGHVENFLEKNTSTFLAYDRNNLCPDPPPKGGGEETPWQIPTIKFPNFPSITDISMGVWDSFTKALQATVDELVVGIIKEVLAILLTNLENILCSWNDMRSFGKERMQSIWDDVEQGAVNEFKSALYDWGINADALLDPANPGTSPDEHITNFMDEVNECLNPGELRAALKGEELGKNSEIIERAASAHLVGLDPNDALAVLAHAARDVDFRRLDERSRFDVGQYVCDEINSLKFDENFRNSFNGRASPEETERMLQIERDASAEKIGNLASLLNMPYDQLLETCGTDQPPLPRDPSAAYIANLAVDAQYAGIENNFSQEMGTYPYLFIIPVNRQAQSGDPEFQVLFLENKAKEGPFSAMSDDDIAEMTRRQIAGIATDSEGQDFVVPPPPGSVVTRGLVLPGLKRSLGNEHGDVLVVSPSLNREGRSNGTIVNFKFPRIDYVPDPTSPVWVYGPQIGPVEDQRFLRATHPDRLREIRNVLENMWYHIFPVLAHRRADLSPIPEEWFYQESYEVFAPLEYLPNAGPIDPVTGAPIGEFEGFSLFTTRNLDVLSTLPNSLIRHIQRHHSDFLRDDANPRTRSAQQIMFANYLTNSISSGFSLPLARLNTQRDAAGFVFGTSARLLYHNSVTAILDQVASLFASSPLFKTTHEGFDIKGLLDIELDPSVQCPPGFRGRDNMLKINFEKKETVRRYESIKRQRENEPPREAGTLPARRKPLQEANLPSILRSIVRIHVVEIALRSIFGLSRFKGTNAILKEGALLEFVKNYTADSLREFITRNTEAFATLGPSANPMVNFENQLVESGLGTIEETIVAVSSGVFEEIEKIMSSEYPNEQREDILLTIGNSMGLVPVPESTFFPGRHVAEGNNESFTPDPFPNLLGTRPAPADDGDHGGDFWEWLDGAFRHNPGNNVGGPRNETQEWGAGGPNSPMTDLQRLFLSDDGGFFQLNPDFQNLEGGYFVFEYFMEFEPHHGADVPHSDVFLTFFENKLENGHIAPAQVENLEAFKEYFKRAVQYYVQQEKVGAVEYDRGPVDDMRSAQKRREGINPDGVFISPTDSTIIQDPAEMERDFFDFSVAMDPPPVFVPPDPLSEHPRDRMRRMLTSPLRVNLPGLFFRPYRYRPPGAGEQAIGFDFQRTRPPNWTPAGQDPDFDSGYWEWYYMDEFIEAEVRSLDLDDPHAILVRRHNFWWTAIEFLVENFPEYGENYEARVDAPLIAARHEDANAEYAAQFAEWEEARLRRQILDPEDPENHPVTRFGLRKLNQYFKSLKYGVRLSYIIPDDVDEIFPPMFSDVGGDMADPNVEELVNQNNAGSFDALAEAKKAYKIRLRTITPARGPRDRVDTIQTVCTLPLLEEMQEIPIDNWTVANFYGSEGLLSGMHWGAATGYTGLSRQEIFNPTITALRNRLIRRNPDFKILFDFALGSTRLTSLLAIYCMQSAGLMNKTLTASFFRTKQSLIAAMYAAQPDLPIENFYRYQDPNLTANGGAPGMLKNQNRFASTSGQSGNAAAKTVPFIVKGLAQYQDPSYALATKLDKAGILPGGLGPTAIVATAPANIVLGSPMPPVTSLGLTAYSLGKLPGENASYDERTARSQGTGTPEGEQCQEIPPEGGE